MDLNIDVQTYLNLTRNIEFVELKNPHNYDPQYHMIKSNLQIGNFN